MEMKKIAEIVKAFADDEKGAASVEYAIIASLIAGVIGIVVAQLGLKVRDMFVINDF